VAPVPSDCRAIAALFLPLCRLGLRRPLLGILMALLGILLLPRQLSVSPSTLLMLLLRRRLLLLPLLLLLLWWLTLSVSTLAGGCIATFRTLESVGFQFDFFLIFLFLGVLLLLILLPTRRIS
jgi:hypothetical protein